MKINTICIVGVGGVGGYFGGKIAQAIARNAASGAQVFFIARGAHLAEIQRHGLMLNTSDQQGIICKPTLATDRLEDVPPPDLYVVCVKGYDLAEIAPRIARNMRPKTALLPLLNGVDVYERIRATLTAGIVLPACVYVGTHIERPGVVTQQGGDGVIVCGRDPRVSAFDPQPLQEFFQHCGINLRWNDDPFPAIWEKFVFIAAYGLVTAHSGEALGAVFANNALRELTRGIMEEIVAIARRKGVALSESLVDDSLAKARNFAPETRTSYQRDAETPGKRNEGDFFGGATLRLGQELGVATPITARIYGEICRRNA